VRVHGCLRDAGLGGDHFRRLAGGDRPQDLELATGEHVVRPAAAHEDAARQPETEETADSEGERSAAVHAFVNGRGLRLRLS